MSKNATIVAGIIGLVVIGGLIFYGYQNKNQTTSENSPAQNTNNNPPAAPAPVSQAGVPIVTTNSQAVPSDTTAIVNGSINPRGALTSYWYEYGTGSSLASKTITQTVGSGYVEIAAPGYITGLAKDTSYSFRLVGENQYGRVTGTVYSFRTTLGNPPPVGSAPQVKTLPANGITRTTANLNGEVTPNRAPTHYWFEYGTSANLGNTTALVAVGDGNAALSASVSLSSLSPSTTYYFRLNAQNQFGTINGAIRNFKTDGPESARPSVTTRNASDVDSTTAQLSGTVSANGLETEYWFEYSTGSLLGSILPQTSGHETISADKYGLSVSTVVSSLSPKTTYYFRLVAQNSLGLTRGSQLTFKTK